MKSNIFNEIKPILDKTENWRTKPFKRFWEAAINYAATGQWPCFMFDDDKNDVLLSTFKEFKDIIDDYTITEFQPIVRFNQFNMCCDADIDIFIDIINSSSIQDNYRRILIDMVKHNHKRPATFYGTPFIYTSNMVKTIGCDSSALYELRDAYGELIKYEIKQTDNYEYPVTFYKLNEKKLYDMLNPDSWYLDFKAFAESVKGRECEY